MYIRFTALIKRVSPDNILFHVKEDIQYVDVGDRMSSYKQIFNSEENKIMYEQEVNKS